ncbi:MAG TPA: type I-E CRISPR-associated protein Cas5/CasD [Candidatus Cloacimonadota bacterium]|nr:type I-E CRISPR-associated protein Cas5/CasD [Candidatus Cloacimonadota bacterium]
MASNTLFLRLEGPLQAWGCPSSKFAVRRTLDFPTKSGVAGLLCSALGVSREHAADPWLTRLAGMTMGVRIDKPGLHWWDYHTVGAAMNLPIAGFKTDKLPPREQILSKVQAAEHPESKPGPMLSRREYLCDASFLVAMQGSEELVELLWKALLDPHWQLFLGRKSCSPSRPIAEHEPGYYANLAEALASIPFSCSDSGRSPETLSFWLEWRAENDDDCAPDEAEIIYDVPLSFAPHSYLPRFIVPGQMQTESLPGCENLYTGTKWIPKRPTADYNDQDFKAIRAKRLLHDHKLCVLCKSPASTVQHISYEHAGGEERLEELASMCRLCHDAATMLEYGNEMGPHRIDPSDPVWREKLLAKRAEIVRFRSRTRRNALMGIKSEDE